MPASVLNHRKKAEHMGKAEIHIEKGEVLVVKEETITKENVVKAVANVVVKAVVENSIMEEDIMKAVFMKGDMGIIVALPIVIGTMCCMRWP